MGFRAVLEMSGDESGVTAFESLSLAVSILAFLVSTVVLLLLVKQVNLLSRQVEDATKQAESENLRQKKQATVDFMSTTLSKLSDIYNQMPPSGSPQQPAFLQQAMERDSAEFVALRDYLNYLEGLCVGVNMEVLDQEVIRRVSGGRIKGAWTTYERWILRERDILRRPLYDELEACAKEIMRLDRADTRPLYVKYRDASPIGVVASGTGTTTDHG